MGDVKADSVAALADEVSKESAIVDNLERCEKHGYKFAQNDHFSALNKIMPIYELALIDAFGLGNAQIGKNAKNNNCATFKVRNEYLPDIEHIKAVDTPIGLVL